MRAVVLLGLDEDGSLLVVHARIAPGRETRAAAVREAAAIHWTVNTLDRPVDCSNGRTPFAEPREEDDRLVCYGLLWDDSGDERIDMDHYLLPGRTAAGVRLFELMEARAAERARANGAGRAVVHMRLNTEPTLDTAVIEARDWRQVRRYQVMTRDISSLGAPPPPPPGLRVRDCAAESDHRIAYELCELTFADHLDHRTRGYEEWLEHQGGDRIDWSLVWIATAEGLGDVGVLVAGNERESMGWIPNLGVVRDARGRGVGGFLLHHAFHTFAGRGRDTVGLGVDTENATGALKLYESNGMRLHFSVDTWELILPV